MSKINIVIQPLMERIPIEISMTKPGAKGIQGEDGNGITSIIRTTGDGSAGTTDTYTVTFTDTTATTFQVYNGADGTSVTADGEDVGDMSKVVYDPDLIGSDIYDLANMKETATEKVLTVAERLEIAKVVDKVDNSQVLTDVPLNALFTDTDTVYTHPANHAISIITGLQIELDGKIDDGQVLTNVPAGALFTETTINSKTGVIAKADIVALGIPAQDTVVDISGKVDNVTGKELSSNDYTTLEKTKLDGVATGAEVNIQSDWDATTGDALILNKPTISSGGGVASVRFVIGTSTAGWTADDCDYLCDGTSDEVEINAAITALPVNGGEILILDGTYNMADSIKIMSRNNVSIRGNGNATILKRMYDQTSVANYGVITLTTATYCTIKDLQVDGNKTVYNSANNTGIYLNSSNNNTITGNTCNNNGRGIYPSTSSDNNTVTGNTCSSNFFGIYLRTSNNNNNITGNTCNNNDFYGIYLTISNNNNNITGNTCDSNDIGIYLSSSSDNNTVTGNTCDSNDIGIQLYFSNNNTTTGNTCNNNGRGIYLSASNNNAITGNTCIRGTGLAGDYTASRYTIQLIGTANNYNLISSNQCMGKAVVIGGGTSNTEVNNKFE